MSASNREAFTNTLESALYARLDLLTHPHQAAVRLFNGFYEGCPELVAEVFAQTLLLHNYAKNPEDAAEILETAAAYYKNRLPWLQAVVSKEHYSQKIEHRCGLLSHGSGPDLSITEHEIRYAVNLMLNQDSSFYLDTCELRFWLNKNMQDKTVLNTFAYTGSLGVAAAAAGSRGVLFTDLNWRFLSLAEESCRLNAIPLIEQEFIRGDFFSVCSRLRRSSRVFDCVILDPPIYSATRRGTVNLLQNYEGLVNKVRPLVANQGYLVLVNNALFLSGRDYFGLLEYICKDGYLTLEEILPVPQDCAGYPETIRRCPPVDPAPFNHPTKIAVLRVRRKDAKV